MVAVGAFLLLGVAINAAMYGGSTAGQSDAFVAEYIGVVAAMGAGGIALIAFGWRIHSKPKQVTAA